MPDIKADAIQVMDSTLPQHRCNWRFTPSLNLLGASLVSTREFIAIVESHLPPPDDDADHSGLPHIALGQGDPSAFPCFAPSPDAESAVVASLLSRNFNCYSPSVGLFDARASVAEYLSKDLRIETPTSPVSLTADDIYLTSGGTQAIEVLFSVLASPGAKVLLPRPGYPCYDSFAAFSGLGVRYYDLVPSSSWEIDVDELEAAADSGTVAIVIVNPGNPCGNVMLSKQLQKVAQVARRLGILVVVDEVYGQVVFGEKPFVPMGTYAGVAPVFSIGLSKRWVVPGWRLGWIATYDPNS